MRARHQGLTLIEILLALIVMMVGLTGILALFPPAMGHAKVSMEETQGAILAESVANALTTAARFAMTEAAAPGAPAGGSSHYILGVNHDSMIDSYRVHYFFKLPNFSDGMAPPGPPPSSPNSGTTWRHHPAPGYAGTPASAQVGPVLGVAPEHQSAPFFRLTGDPWTKAQFDLIKGTDLSGTPGTSATGSDQSEPTDQFGYSFQVRKINTLEYLMTASPTNPVPYTLTQLDSLVRMWEVRIHTFRLAGQGSFSSGTGAGGGGAGMGLKKIIATVTTRLTVR